MRDVQPFLRPRGVHDIRAQDLRMRHQASPLSLSRALTLFAPTVHSLSSLSLSLALSRSLARVRALFLSVLSVYVSGGAQRRVVALLHVLWRYCMCCGVTACVVALLHASAVPSSLSVCLSV